VLTADGLTPCVPLYLAAGKQQVPGVYLSSSTALCEPGAAEPLDADSYAAGLAVLAGSSSPRSTQVSKAGTGFDSSGTGSPPPQHAPLMHAGRPTRLGGPVLPPQQQQQGSGTIAAVAGGQASTVGAASEQLGSTTTGSSSSTAGKGPVLDVYGQPRVVPPALPGTYFKARAAGSINAQYLSREGPTRRAAKTSSASLVRASGKEGESLSAQHSQAASATGSTLSVRACHALGLSAAGAHQARQHTTPFRHAVCRAVPAGTQVVLRPDHLHFGSIPSGTVVHRTARLLNGSADVVRFTILRPQLPLRCGPPVHAGACHTFCALC
jgi:CRISPR-associated protein Cas5t